LYILKTKGTERIPEYIQFRNDDLILINHFKAGECDKAVQKYGSEEQRKKLAGIIREAPYGKLIKIETE